MDKIKKSYGDVGTDHLAALLYHDYSSIFNDEMTHNHIVFIGKIYNIEGDELLPEGHVLPLPDISLQSPILHVESASLQDIASLGALIEKFTPTKEEINQIRNMLLHSK